MRDKLHGILARLKEAPAILSAKKVAAGFDGFVDSIVKVVNTKTDDGDAVFFETIKEFGGYISGKSGSGFSLESEELFQKLGGNMPIMANAMAQLGTAVDCIGALGLPAVHAAFSDMSPGCTLHSFTNPGFTTAMEFTDGKIMLAQMTDLNRADWETIRETIGLQKLQEIFGPADLICLVNWSEPEHSNNMWQGLLDDVLTDAASREKQFFVDLSDFSKRSADVIRSALELIKQFGHHGKVTLSLNRNEAGILYKILKDDSLPEELQIIGAMLYPILGVAALIIHTSKMSLIWDATGCYSDKPQFIAKPTISTGAGDNFNAGFCIAQLLRLDAEQSLVLANSTSHCYIKTGFSPSLTVLHHHISGLISASL